VKKLGLIINPVAGMGGRVGLKGTDGADILEKAIQRGAVPESPGRAAAALRRLESLKSTIEIITYPGEMGEDTALTCGFEPRVIGAIRKGKTGASDTRNAARSMAERAVDLLLFAGGDGTARDICSAVGGGMVTLGIPAGVKIHSAVFARSPLHAGNLAALYLRNQAPELKEAEVMDIDEESFRRGRVTAKLYGYLKIPFERAHVQGLKSGSAPNERYAQEAIAADIIESMDDTHYYIIGPGTTTMPVMEKLHLDGTLLGVDLVHRKKLASRDLGEKELLRHTRGKKVKIIVTPIGGQGYLFGRGNQQVSPDVIRQAGRDNIIIAATPGKISSLRCQPFLVDSGDTETDRMMSGYFVVTTGYHDRAVYRAAF